MSKGAVLITGAATRLGAEIARSLASDGWNICIHYNSSETAAKTLCQEIGAVSIQADLLDKASLETLITRASKALGAPLTALINNASSFEPDHAGSMSQESYELHMDINLRAPLFLSQSFAAQCLDQGCIINLIDQRVLKPNPSYFSYSLSKAALYTATKIMAQSFAPKIRVNAIGPGPTLKNSGQTQKMFEDEAKHTLLQRPSAPDDIIAGIRYLLEAKAVTGQMIAIDSGQHLAWDTKDILSASHPDALPKT